MKTPNEDSTFRITIAAVVIACAVIAVYLGSFKGVFLFDDQVHIVNNDRIKDFSSLSAMLSGKRPTVDLSLAMNYRAGSLEVTGYHAFNIAIHLCAALTLFGVVRRTLLCASLRGRFQSSAIWVAMTVAIIWGVHPLQTQSVTYLIQRAESMMALFYLLTLYGVLRGSEAKRPALWYAMAIVSCALGMGCKAVMVTAPLVILLYDRTFLARSGRSVLRRRWGLYLGLAASWSVLWACGIAGAVLSSTTKGAHVGFGFKGITPLEYLMTQAGVLTTYLKLLVWPRPLCLDYGWPVAHDVIECVLPGIVVTLLVGVAVWGSIKRCGPSFLVMSFFLILAPTSSVVPIKDVFFEHRLYLPLACGTVLAVLGAYLLVERIVPHMWNRRATAKWIPAGLAVAAVLTLGTATVRRNRIYASPLDMWRDVTLKRPGNARAFENLGTQWVAVGNKAEAVVQYTEAVRVDPDFESAHSNLANALLETGDTPGAIREYREVIRLNPNHTLATVNLGYALQQLGRKDEAIEYFRIATKIDVRNTKRKELANAHFALGTALARQSEYVEAEPEFREAIRHWPGYEKAHRTLGIVLRRLGRLDEAIDSFRRALEINPLSERSRRLLDQTIAERASAGNE